MKYSEFFFRLLASLCVLLIGIAILSLFIDGSQGRMLVPLLAAAYLSLISGVLCRIWKV